MKRNGSRWIIEAVAWSIFLGFPLLIFPSLDGLLGGERIKVVFTATILSHLFFIAYYYLNSFFFLPKFYFSGKHVQFFILTLIPLLLATAVLLSDERYNPLSQTRFFYADIAFAFSIFIRFMMMFLLSLGLASYSRFKEAEAHKLSAELNFLKAQINPHFLFNTLNSIYALSVKGSDKTPESVTRLSSIMRYVIKDAAADKVPLESELRYIRDYVDLERLRLNQNVQLEFSQHGETGGLSIAPLIFVPAIENVFKHGVSTREKVHLKIAISVNGSELSAETENDIVKKDGSANNGIGLQNMSKRLELLYADRFSLEYGETDNKFKLQLKIRLK